MKKVKGCAFICDLNGTLIRVLRDDFNLLEKSAKGKPFIRFFTSDSSSKALDLMLEVKDKNIAFDHRLSINVGDSEKSLYFFGVNLVEEVLLIGADNHYEAMEFTNYIHEINSEQANSIRSLIKENQKISSDLNAETENLFDELSKLNNELVNTQRELNKKNIELERLNDIKNKFMGIASHDLRNPLNVIKIYTEFLLEEVPLVVPDEHKEYLNIIKDSAAYMIRLVNDLLDYSKIESHNIALNIETFDFIKLTQGIVQLNEPLAEKKGISIKMAIREDKLLVDGDIFKMEQVLNNLLSNAIKFSLPDTDILMNIESKNGLCLFNISNTGAGIKQESAQKVFKPFEKIANSGTANEKGSGLGLFIVKQIIDAHKGKIWFDSKPNELTTFFIELPQKTTA
jgi:signal transduction histidine kinase